jgi:dTDP-4-amino-4,6-dideoxygalactose transaminase
MDAIMKIAHQHNLFVIEDAAQCIGATYKTKHLGTIGHLGTLSFHYTKNITSGLGGALLVNDQSLIDRAKVLWQKGTNREAFLEGQVDKYTWVDKGSSFMMPELSAALLASQLEQLNKKSTQRQAIWNYYHENLRSLERKGCLRLPFEFSEGNHNAHIFYLICHDQKDRNQLIRFLKERDIQATFHYVPLHSTEAGKKFSLSNKDLKNTDWVSSSIIRLPLHDCMTLKDASTVIEAINQYFAKSMSADLVSFQKDHV